jgi:hypothetical protein
MEQRCGEEWRGALLSDIRSERLLRRKSQLDVRGRDFPYFILNHATSRICLLFELIANRRMAKSDCCWLKNKESMHVDRFGWDDDSRAGDDAMIMYEKRSDYDQGG